MDKMREEFEIFWVARCEQNGTECVLTKLIDDEYYNLAPHYAWVGWQAAKATPAVPDFTIPDRMDYELNGDTVINNPFVDGYNQALSDVISMNEEYANSTVSDGWIPVSARPPERKQGNKIWATDGITQFECEFDDDFWCNIFGNEFTHWKELPSAPDQNK